MTSLKSLPWVRRDSAKVLLIGALVFLFFFNAGRALRFGSMNWQSDQGCYLEHLGDLIGIHGERGELCTMGLAAGFDERGRNQHASGAAIVWMVPGLIAKSVAHWRSENVTSWVLTFAALTSYLSWVLSLYFVLKIVNMKAGAIGLQRKWAPLLALFFLFNAYTLHYATADPIMAHAVEIMAASACVYFILKDQLLAALLFAVLLTVTRYNDAPVALLIAGRLLDKARSRSSFAAFTRSQKIALSLGLLCVLSFGGWIAFFKGYYGTTLPDLLEDVRWQNFELFLYSLNWGMLWSGSWWLAAFALGIYRFREGTYLFKAATAWLALGALLVIVWGGNGTDFGNRYLIGSYCAGLLVWLEALEMTPRTEWKRKAFRGLTWANGTWVMLMTMIYATRPSMNPTWERGVCFTPSNITGETFMNLLNPDVYMTAFFRQVPAVTLYFSRFPNRLPAGREMIQIVGTEWWILTGMSILCATYLAAYLAAFLVSARRRHLSA